MTTDEAAKRMGVTRRTIERWIAAGRLEHRIVKVDYPPYRVREITIGMLHDFERHHLGAMAPNGRSSH